MSDIAPVEEGQGTDEHEALSNETSQPEPEKDTETPQNVAEENDPNSVGETKLETIDEAKDSVTSGEPAAETGETEADNVPETGEQVTSEPSHEEAGAEGTSVSANESRKAEEIDARLSQQEKRISSLDEFEKETDRKADVVITKSKPEEDVIEEVRSQYLWEGSCSSSSTSEEKKKKEKSHSEESEEESSSSEEIEIIVFPREEYINKYKGLILERIKLQKKNVILQKYVFEYCKKRKLEVYFEDIATPDPKLETKYTRQLKVFQDFLELDKERRISLREDLDKLQVEQAEAEVTFNRLLEELLETEREVGTGLISAVNGKPLPDKSLDKLLQKQRKTILELHEIRLKYIRLRDSLAAKETSLKNLETFGEGLHLLDYEQLRLENQSYSDKIEERDEELTRLRTNATSSIQILAHIREKANYTTSNIEDLYDELEFMESEANRVREFTGELKKQRDELREQLARLRREAGLLVHQRLIKDFERRIEDSQSLAVEIENLKNNYYDQNKRLSKVQETIKFHKSFRESANPSSNYDYSDLLAHKRGQTASLAQDPNLPKSIPQDAGERSLDEIKKTRPMFFPREKYSRIITYVKEGKLIEKETKDE